MASLESIIPTIGSLTPTELVSTICSLSAKGVKVYITQAVLKAFKDLFEKIGIQVREATGEIKESSYILISTASGNIRIVVVNNGERVLDKRIPFDRFKKALEEYANKLSKTTTESMTKYYELYVPKEIIEKLEESSKGDDDEQ